MSENESFPLEPALEFVFEARVKVDPPMMLGEVDGAQRRIVPIASGVVDGPRLRGEVLARYVIRADDGTMISVVNRGVRRASPDVIRRLLAGERVEPSLVYFRCAPTFEVGAGPHRWLTENIFVTAGKRAPDSVDIRFYVVR